MEGKGKEGLAQKGRMQHFVSGCDYADDRSHLIKQSINNYNQPG
jgi:hypothetical protein